MTDSNGSEHTQPLIETRDGVARSAATASRVWREPRFGARFRLTVAAMLAVAVAVITVAMPTTSVLPTQAQTMPNPSVCDRTPQIRDAVFWKVQEAVPSVTSCADITATQLAAVTELHAVNHGTNLRTLVATDFAGMTGLTQLWLWGNAFTTVPANVFNGLTALQTLSLGHNSLQSLDENLFDGLANLRTLYLDVNQLTQLHEDTFDGLTNLQTLNLNDNQLTQLHEDIFDGLASLQTLYLNENQLTQLHEDVFDGLASLQTLYLNDNRLTQLDADVFDGLASLQTLYLNGNQLTQLDQDIFDGLVGLQTLYLHSNQLTQLHEDTFDRLASLVRLTMYRNALTQLHEDIFDGLTSLAWLVPAVNQLTTLPEDIFDGLSNLHTLYLDDNPFTDGLPVDIFDGLTGLRVLGMVNIPLATGAFPDGLLEGLNLDEFHAGLDDQRLDFKVNLVRTPGDPSEGKLTFPLGAPFDMNFDILAYGDRYSYFETVHSNVVIGKGDTQSGTFTLPMEISSDLVVHDGGLPQVVVRPDLNPDSIYVVCETPGGFTYSCYTGFNVVTGPSLPEIVVVSVNQSSAQIGWSIPTERDPKFLLYRVLRKSEVVGETTSWKIIMYGTVQATGPGSTRFGISGLTPDQDHGFIAWNVNENGVASTSVGADFYGRSRTDLRTEPSVPPASFVVEPRPDGEGLTWMAYRTPEVYEAGRWVTADPLGYQLRFKKTSVAGWPDWEVLDAETTPDGMLTASLDNLEGGVEYDVQLRAITGFESYSEPATTTVLTFIPLPVFNKVEPGIRSLNVTAGERVRLDLDVYDRQVGLANEKVDTEAEEDDVDDRDESASWDLNDLVIEWSDGSGGGSFTDTDSPRSVVYTAPGLPGTYTVRAEAGPPGLCYYHHVDPNEGDEPCATEMTVRVSRPGDRPIVAAEPVNPTFAIPTTVDDASGTAHTVFTPIEGGAYSHLAGITVSAQPGAVPNGTALAVAAKESAKQIPSTDADARLEVLRPAFDVTGLQRGGDGGSADWAVASGYRLNEPLTACIRVPIDYTNWLSSLSIVELRTDGTVGRLTSTLRTVDGSTQVCGAFSVVPITVALAASKSTSVTTPTAEATPTPRELPETGGRALSGLTAAVVLLFVTAAVTAVAVVLLATRRRRITHDLGTATVCPDTHSQGAQQP